MCIFIFIVSFIVVPVVVPLWRNIFISAQIDALYATAVPPSLGVVREFGKFCWIFPSSVHCRNTRARDKSLYLNALHRLLPG